MPIRFRCGSCDGLLSIARRKAGLSIQCPKCQFPVTVPDASTDLALGEGEGEENDDVQQIAEGARRPTPTTGTLNRVDAAPKLDQPQLTGGVDPTMSSVIEPTQLEIPAETGITVTPKTVALLALLFIVLMALSFATGFLLGS